MGGWVGGSSSGGNGKQKALAGWDGTGTWSEEVRGRSVGRVCVYVCVVVGE